MEIRGSMTYQLTLTTEEFRLVQKALRTVADVPPVPHFGPEERMLAAVLQEKMLTDKHSWLQSVVDSSAKNLENVERRKGTDPGAGARRV